jgi:hypothetical protein
VLVECGFLRAQSSDGREWTFTPSLARIASLGSPTEIVELYGALHGPRAVRAAMYVLAALCDQPDPFDLIGYVGVRENSRDLERVPGLMPAAEMVVLAQHLMHHGIAGKAKPGGQGTQQGKYSDRFDASEFVSLARAHLGLSSTDAEALSMTELQQMLSMKFPEQTDASGKPMGDVPTREEYEAQMRQIMERRNG